MEQDRGTVMKLSIRPRTLGRRLAVQYLFMADIQKYAPDMTPPRELFAIQRSAVREARRDTDELPDLDNPKIDDSELFALELIDQVLRNRVSIDEEINRVSTNWTVDRIGIMERNILRLAAAELRLNITPREVVLQQATDLAARFVDNDAAAFVNGVADRLEGGHSS